MCLLLLAFRSVPGKPWLLLGNRDEFHGRASAAAAEWPDLPGVVGGRDLEAGGSWLALNRDGRFAAVTNVRLGTPRRGPRSRGELVSAFVGGVESPARYAADIARRRDEYGPFNLIVGDRDAAFGASSTRAHAWDMAPGVHVLSNGPPDAVWPKVERVRGAFTAMLQSGQMRMAATDMDSAWLDLLADLEQPPDEDLPDTGVGLELERVLAPIFIRGTQYGTRASTLAYLRDDGGFALHERRFGPGATAAGESRIEG